MMKKLLFPLILIVCGCSYFYYDSGWVDGNADWSGKLTKSDMVYLKSLSIFAVGNEVVSGDELSKNSAYPIL
jgi:hypothetical protein